MKVIFQGKILKDTDVLVDINVKNDSTMHLVITKGNLNYNPTQHPILHNNKRLNQLNYLHNNQSQDQVDWEAWEVSAEWEAWVVSVEWEAWVEWVEWTHKCQQE